MLMDQKLAAALRTYLSGKQLKNLQPSSLALYQRDLKELCGFGDRAQALDHLRRLRPRTRLRKLTIWRSFTQWLAHHSPPLAAPIRALIEGVESPRLPRQEPKILTPEAETLLRRGFHDRDPSSTRMKLILDLGLDLGLRISEVLALQWRDLEGDWLRIRRKGGHEQRLPLSTSLRASFRALESLSAYTRPEDFVFSMSPHQRLTARAVQIQMKKAALRLQIKQPLSPHVLRHTFATRMATKGTPLHVLKEILGHRSLQTTERYLHVLPTHIQNAFVQLRE